MYRKPPNTVGEATTEPPVTNSHAWTPVALSSATTLPSRSPKNTRSPATAGVECTASPASTSQTTSPVCPSSARSLPSPVPMYATPPATDGEAKSCLSVSKLHLSTPCGASRTLSAKPVWAGSRWYIGQSPGADTTLSAVDGSAVSHTGR